MGFHVYCIAPERHPVPGEISGLDRQRPVAIAADGLAAWVTRHDAPVPASIDAVRRHHDVVTAAMTPDVTPVPVRYGQWFASDEDAAERLIADGARWSELLDRFRGRAEHGVHVQLAEPDAERDVHPTPAESGREYMAALARKQARATARRGDAERIAALIESRVGGLAADRRIEFPSAGPVLVSVAHLVAWSDSAAYDGAVAGVSGAAIVRTGPWPPYSFAG